MDLEFPSADPRLGELPVALAVLDRFYWNISIEHVGDEVRLRGGELLIARFPSMHELEVFAAGMALSLSVLPDEVVDVIDRWTGH